MPTPKPAHNAHKMSALSSKFDLNSSQFVPVLNPSRRQILAAADATASLATLASLRPARAAEDSSTTAADFTSTNLKAADLKDNEFTATSVSGVLVARTGKTVAALSNKCTHQGCGLTPKPGAKILTCPCHRAEFNLDGTVAKTPAGTPLSHYAIRLIDKGIVEVDTSRKPPKDDKSATATIG